MEVRYIIFSPDEVRSAVISFLQKQGQISAPNDVAAVETVGPNDAPTALIRLNASDPEKPIRLGEQYLVAALLIHCVTHRIPMPKQATKKVTLSVNGLTLEMTTDRAQGAPSIANHLVSYGEIANRATQKIDTVQEALTRAIARADYAERRAAEAEERAVKAEAARGKSSAVLTAVALVPGLRGRIGRWLVRFRFPYANEQT